MCEAARNVSCVGAKPIAITNCLNFGNPDNGPIAYQLAQAIEGMAQACEALGTPVISGNVSLYNESFEQPIYPTAVVGMLGVMDDVTANCTVALQGRRRPGLPDGRRHCRCSTARNTRSAGSAAREGRPAGRIPDVDLDAEVALQAALRQAIAARMLRSAHDVSDGGLAVAVAESCMAGKIGARLSLDDVPWVGGRPGCAASAGGAEVAHQRVGPLAKRARPGVLWRDAHPGGGLGRRGGRLTASRTCAKRRACPARASASWAAASWSWL